MLRGIHRASGPCTRFLCCQSSAGRIFAVTGCANAHFCWLSSRFSDCRDHNPFAMGCTLDMALLPYGRGAHTTVVLPLLATTAPPAGFRCSDHYARLGGEVSCEVQIGDEAVHFLSSISEHSHGSLIIQFPQQSISLPTHPAEGDPAMVRIKAQPSWWRGRSHELMQTVQIGITDHRDDATKRSDDTREAIAALDTLIVRGNQLLKMCGRPDEDYYGAPMFFIDHCLPKMNEFGQEAANTVLLVAPEYIGKLVNTGNVTHGDKKASVQQLERWLEKSRCDPRRTQEAILSSRLCRRKAQVRARGQALALGRG